MMVDGKAVQHALAGVGVLVLLGGIAFAVQWCESGCAIWQHEEARSAAEMACVERYKTEAQIAQCREVVNGITSKFADAGPRDTGTE